jgi:hypothetical protein
MSMPPQVAKFNENSIECGTLLEMMFLMVSILINTLEDSSSLVSVWEEVSAASAMLILPNLVFLKKSR